MDIQEIEIFIDQTGKVMLQVKGAKGLVCLELTKDLEAALGNVLLERKMTPESLEPPKNPNGASIDLKT